MYAYVYHLWFQRLFQPMQAGTMRISQPLVLTSFLSVQIVFYNNNLHDLSKDSARLSLVEAWTQQPLYTPAPPHPPTPRFFVVHLLMGSFKLQEYQLKYDVREFVHCRDYSLVFQTIRPFSIRHIFTHTRISKKKTRPYQ